MDLSIIIPCYNEIENVSHIMSELMPVAVELAYSKSVEIVFVDDGSQDGTLVKLQEAVKDWESPALNFKFERHEVNRGLGAALRTGFAACAGEVVVTTDSDGTYKFSEIPTLLSYLGSDIDLVTASPYHPQGGVEGVPAYRLILSRGSSLLYRILVDWNIHTYTALFRAYRQELIRTVPFQADGYLAGTELLVKSMLSGYRVVEYPAVLYRRAFGVSKAKLVRTISAHLRFQGRVILHRLHLLSLTN